MKKILLPLAVLVAGLGVGGGAAFGTSMLVGKRPAGAAVAAKNEKTGFVPATKIIAPLVLKDGTMSGYVSFDASLEVPLDEVESVNARMPLLLHAINMQTYRTPMAAGPDGLLPELETFRTVVRNAATQVYGPNVVRFVAVTNAVPA
ncbi:hypothetical protein ACBY01_04310 [Sphingomonas sp. ac-8]|uniref:hypothetical protein n=1 Tax=Sphingomonas sp. ac-8 TaxID=3242977 RepID=UPI003A7F9E46